MAGRDVPTQLELRDKLHKRMYLLDHGPGSRVPSKRFNRQGVPSASSGAKTSEAIEGLELASGGHSGKKEADQLKGEGKHHGADDVANGSSKFYFLVYCRLKY